MGWTGELHGGSLGGASKEAQASTRLRSWCLKEKATQSSLASCSLTCLFRAHPPCAGFHEFAEFVAEDVGTLDSGLNSVVLANNNE